MVQVLSLLPRPATQSASPAPVLAPDRRPPIAVAVALRGAAVVLLIALWARLLTAGLAGEAVAIERSLGSHLLALGVEGFGVIYLVLSTVRVGLWLFYKPVPACSDDALLPTVTAIVPAYNEGAMVRHALLSLAGGDYPAGKLQIVAVDDGSRDDTFAHMEAAARLYPGRILLLKQPQNRGKRAALQAGFSAARSELVVTADSDCILAPDAVRQLVAPFRDPKVGAVAGRVLIHNRRGSWLTRLLAPQFTLTFDLLRAAQSVNGTVLCCPGALSAFRLAAVREALPRWLNQRFFGTKVGPGEDRFLTTLMLRAGYTSRYQASAKVFTLVPTEYGKVCKMLLRWDRCDLRESLEAFWFWPRRAGLGLLALPVYFGLALETLLAVPVTVVILGVLAVLLVTHPVLFLVGLVGLNLPLVLSALLCLSADFTPETLLLWGYAAFWPAIAWIQPYAAVTLQDQAWMSRDRPAVRVPAAQIAA